MLLIYPTRDTRFKRAMSKVCNNLALKRGRYHNPFLFDFGRICCTLFEPTKRGRKQICTVEYDGVRVRIECREMMLEHARRIGKFIEKSTSLGNVHIIYEE